MMTADLREKHIRMMRQTLVSPPMTLTFDKRVSHQVAGEDFIEWNGQPYRSENRRWNDDGTVTVDLVPVGRAAGSS